MELTLLLKAWCRFWSAARSECFPDVICTQMRIDLLSLPIRKINNKPISNNCNIAHCYESTLGSYFTHKAEVRRLIIYEMRVSQII